MITINQTFNTILKALDYLHSPGFVWGNQNNHSTHRDFLYNQITKKINVDGIYFIKDNPVICFKAFEKHNEDQITKLHKTIWNHGKIPLLFVWSGDEFRIYSTYQAPVLKNSKISIEHALICSSTNVDSVQAIKENFKDFERIEIDSGLFWRKYSEFLSYDSRINQYLIESFKELRKQLAATGLSFNYIHPIIARVIIIQYLEHRQVFDLTFYKNYNAKYTCFIDVLASLAKTYKLFQFLTDFFGNDIFSITAKEKHNVSLKNLNVLKNVLKVDAEKFPNCHFNLFEFNIIPVEMICSVFEEFLYEEKSKDIASYTPPALASIMLNHVMPRNAINKEYKVLDPACGASIFLLEAFNRLVENHVVSSGKAPTIKDLSKILSDNIFGFDLKSEALQFTAIALSLTLLEYIDYLNVEIPLDLPAILGKNLIRSDFFNTGSTLHRKKYDLIIGNPPWQSNYGEKANNYLKETGFPVGDKQISQVFMWQAGDLLNENGQVCMLMPSKGLLYNFNPKNIEFREQFFETYNIKKIINLSLFSNLLFENSKFPATIIVYSKSPENADKQSTIYYSPKPSHKAWEFATLLEDSSDVKALPKHMILKSHAIWKITFVGSVKDYSLINKLEKEFPTIDSICENRQWKYGEGFQLGGGDKNINNKMSKLPYISAKSICPFYIDKEDLDPLGTSVFHRPRDFDLYKAPHTIVRGGQIYATYLDFDAVFTHAVMCFACTDKAESENLKLLAAYLNSSLALYYLFLTSSTWCVERTDIHLAEYRNLPFVLSANKILVKNILSIYDQLSAIVAEDTKNFDKSEEYQTLKSKLDDCIFDLFNLTEEERHLILDVNKFSIHYFQEYSKSLKAQKNNESYKKPTGKSLENYAIKFSDRINQNISKYNYKLVSEIYLGDTPLEVIMFQILPKDSQCKNINFISDPDKQRNLLKKLDTIVLKQTQQGLYHRKNIRVFEGNKFYIVKPSEAKAWNLSSSIIDADSNLKEILKGFND